MEPNLALEHALGPRHEASGGLLFTFSSLGPMPSGRKEVSTACSWSRCSVPDGQRSHLLCWEHPFTRLLGLQQPGR